MLNLLNLVIFLFGLVTGSFLNCLIYRLYTKKGFLFGRSFCPHCRHKLSWSDLIPVLSFLALKGKCRYCSKKISWQYPLVEIATGILFVLVVNYELGIRNYELFNLETLLASLLMILAFCFLIIIFVYDLKHYIIPDKIIYPAIAIAFLYQLFRNLESGIWNLDFRPLLYPLLSALLASTFFLAIFLISRGKWLGFGDVKLVFFLGLLLGFPNILVALFLAFFIGAGVGILLIAFRKKTLKSEVPFGPFLVSGTFLALFFGQNIVDCYLSLFWL